MRGDDVIGIDLGTTTSIYTPKYGSVVIENDKGRLITPSVVAFNKAELLSQATERKKTRVGDAAEITASSDFVVISDAKRIIGKKLYDKDVTKIRHLFGYPLIQDGAGSAIIQIPQGDDKGSFSNIYPQVVSAEVLKYIYKSYRRKNNSNAKLKAVVTIPAVFKETQRAATHEAAQIANIEIIKLVSEPTAAAVQYLCGNEHTMDRISSKNGLFLVFDLGGGTLDVSIVSSSEDGACITVKAVDGDPLLGGRDFDQVSSF